MQLAEVDCNSLMALCFWAILVAVLLPLPFLLFCSNDKDGQQSEQSEQSSATDRAASKVRRKRRKQSARQRAESPERVHTPVAQKQKKRCNLRSSDKRSADKDSEDSDSERVNNNEFISAESPSSVRMQFEHFLDNKLVYEVSPRSRTRIVSAFEQLFSHMPKPMPSYRTIVRVISEQLGVVPSVEFESPKRNACGDSPYQASLYDRGSKAVEQLFAQHVIENP